jgi:hypothetical protein
MGKGSNVSECDTHTKQKSESGEASIESLSPDQIINKETRVLAYLPLAHGTETDVELSARRTDAKVAERTITFLEFCVTTINTTTGARTTRCVPVRCPPTGRAPMPTTRA